MGVPLGQCSVGCAGELFERWSLIVPEFSCRPDDLRHYLEAGRWDLVFNAICYLTGVVEEGSA